MRRPFGADAGRSGATTLCFPRITPPQSCAMADEYKLVPLPNGTHAVHAASYDEKMHPGLGPAAEAEALYVRQLKIRERMQAHAGEFVVWDVGLGAAANALTLLRLTRDLPGPLRLVSFDDTSGPLEFALAHPEELAYLRGYDATVRELITNRSVTFKDGARRVEWEFHLGDFPGLLAWARQDARPTNERMAAPHATFFDAFSPAKNPAMWTLPVFTNLFHQLDPARPSSLTTYSRSTLIRATLLRAGFFVGRGIPTGWKEETTVAANTFTLLDAPLEKNWLERARRSDSAEPLRNPVYRREKLSDETWAKLQAHPQFQP